MFTKVRSQKPHPSPIPRYARPPPVAFPLKGVTMTGRGLGAFLIFKFYILWKILIGRKSLSLQLLCWLPCWVCWERMRWGKRSLLLKGRGFLTMTITITMTYFPRMYTNETLIYFSHEIHERHGNYTSRWLIDWRSGGKCCCTTFPSFADECHLKVKFQMTLLYKWHSDAAGCISPRLQSMNEISDVSFLLWSWISGFTH